MRPNPNAVDLSHFRIETSIGKGGFGKVNCVTQKKNGKLFAMKTINKTRCFTANTGVEQVFAELKLLSQLQHPNLCNAYYGFQDEDNLYLVMDLALGGDVRFQLSAHKAFSEDLTRFVTASLVLALGYLHSKNVLHRDIKPANMLMTSEGYVLLTDFGLSCYLPDVNPNQVCGTDGYIAPELYRGIDPNNAKAAFASDWFAVGVCLYQFAVGEKPFTSGKRLQPDSPDLRKATQLLKNKPEHLQSLVWGLLEIDVERRLGYNGVDEIKAHPFFEGFDWQALEERRLEAPFKPDVSKKNVDRRISVLDLEEQLVGFNAYAPRLDKSKQHHFENYQLNVELQPDDVEFVTRASKCVCVVL